MPLDLKASFETFDYSDLLHDGEIWAEIRGSVTVVHLENGGHNLSISFHLSLLGLRGRVHPGQS